MESKNTNDQIEELKVKEKFLEAINSFTTQLFQAQTINEIVWAVTQNAISKLGYVDCIIYLYDKEKDRLIQSAAFGPKNPEEQEIIAPIEIKPGDGIVGTVFATGKAELIGDTSKDPRYIVDDDIRYSELAVPMYYNHEIMGVIDSEHPDKDFFTDQDLNILTTIAALVSTKIAQARATEELMKYQVNLEKIIREKTSELEIKNEQLTAQNKEKELLIKEIHHRVKNNMQIMASLANLQLHNTTDENVQNSLKQFSSRIGSMAIIHEKLYQNSEMSSITVDSYLVDLVENITYSFDQQGEIELDLNIESIHIDLDSAIPLGLLVNELVTNSIKHAFAEQEHPQIKIQVVKDKEFTKLCYCDNGPGFDFEDEHSESFGIELISVLSDQIGSEFKHQNEDGYKFEIKFKLDV